MTGERILLIDDEAGIRASLGRVLTDEGYAVESVPDGERGLAKLAKGDFNLVLLDVWLPKRDGLEILQEMRARGIDVPVVMISGHANIDTAVRATRLGAWDFIEKPLTIEKITVSVRNALKQHRLEGRNLRLRNALQAHAPRTLIGESAAVVALREQIERAAPTNGRVLIMGENGTGKELVARMIHSLSLRTEEPFIEMNCAAIPEELIESELFGHVRGAFTGAMLDRRGKFELADGGTLFLDEIGDMSLKTQAKVLRALQEQVVEPVGGAVSVRVDVRVLAATNKDLPTEIRASRFREDLYFRLNVIPIFVPPLRDRADDVPRLAEYFMSDLAREYGRRRKTFDALAMSTLRQYRWPGNVREMRNVLERLMIMVPGDTIANADLSFLDGATSVERAEGSRLVPLHDARDAFERDYILKALAGQQGNISRTADALGVERSNLYRKMKSFGIAPARRVDEEEEPA